MPQNVHFSHGIEVNLLKLKRIDDEAQIGDGESRFYDVGRHDDPHCIAGDHAFNQGVVVINRHSRELIHGDVAQLRSVLLLLFEY